MSQLATTKMSITPASAVPIVTKPKKQHLLAWLVLTPVAWLWTGLLLGISFLESWVKFTALQGIENGREIGLRIGKEVFSALAITELVLCLPVIICAFILPRHWRMVLALPLILIVIQQSYLKPILDSHIEAISQGLAYTSSWHHVGFIILETIKLLFLMMLGVIGLRQIVGSQQPAVAPPHHPAGAPS